MDSATKKGGFDKREKFDYTASASRRRSFNRDLGGQARWEGQNGARDSRGFDGVGRFKTSRASKLKSSKAQKLIGPRRLFMSPATCNKIWRERGRLIFGARKLFSRLTIPQVDLGHIKIRLTVSNATRILILG